MGQRADPEDGDDGLAMGRAGEPHDVADGAFDALIEASLDAVLIGRLDGPFLRANAQACRLFGCTEQDLITLGRAAFVDLEDPRVVKLLAARRKHGSARGQLRMLKKDGTPLDVEVSSVLFHDIAGNACFSSCIRDLAQHRQAERRAREAEDRMSAALDAAEVGYWSFDLASGLGYRSASLFRSLGYAQPVPGWTHADFERRLHPADRERVVAARAAAGGGAGQYEEEFRVIWPDGSVHWMWSKGRTYFDAGDRAHRMAGVQIDITRRKETEAALLATEARFASVVELSQEGILIHRDARILYANPAAARILAAGTPEQMVGLTMADLLEPASRAIGLARRDWLQRDGGSLPYIEVQMVRRDGVVIDVELAGTAIDSGGERIIHTQIRDIGERKQHERDVLALNASLEERVVERTRELAAANRELESFAYMAAHDLRAPLRAVSGFSSMLEDSLGDKLGGDDRKCLDTITASVGRMNDLIDGLLEFSRSGRGPLTRRLMDARMLAEAVITELDGRARAEIVMGALPELNADPVLLRQIFINLISNALKYSRGRDAPRVEISSTELHGDPVICVADNGVGFNPAYASKLFGVFQRLHPASEFEGTGVGLAIVKKIVERHGGKVWAEAQVGQGARFFFSLPGG